MNLKLIPLIIVIVLAGFCSSESKAQFVNQDQAVFADSFVDSTFTDSDVSSDTVSAAFPTYWIGEYPPVPPYGYMWIFEGRDYYGRAHWYLVRC